MSIDDIVLCWLNLFNERAIVMDNDVEEKTLLAFHPLMFRGEPVGFVICVVLIFVFGLGLLISHWFFGLGLLLFLLVLLMWWLWCESTIYKITNLRVVEQTGILSLNTNEVRHVDIRNVKMNQGIFQRICGTGSVAISSAGQSDIELTMRNIEEPEKIVDTIRTYQG